MSKSQEIIPKEYLLSEAEREDHNIRAELGRMGMKQDEVNKFMSNPSREFVDTYFDQERLYFFLERTSSRVKDIHTLRRLYG